MELKSMKLNESDKKEFDDTYIAEKPDYPYGLKIHLDQGSLEKLGIDGSLPSVGSKLMVMAEVEVCSASQSEYEKGKKRSDLGLQITSMALSKKMEKDHAESLYGE